MSFLGPFPVDDAIARLQKHAKSLKIVSGAAGLRAALDSHPNNNPAAYVLSEERGGKVKFSGPPMQQPVAVSLQVVLFVQSAANEKAGAGAEALMRTVKKDVRHALLGWVAGPAFSELTFQGERPEPYKAGWYAVQVIFVCEYTMSHKAPE